MSKSVGNVVGAWTLADKYGREAIRYFVLREMTFGLDADFSEEALVGRLNADLANDLGNLVSRATTVDRELRRRRGARAPVRRRPRRPPLAAGLGAGARRRGQGHGRVRLPARARRHLGVHRRRQPLRGRAGPVGAGQGSRAGRAPAHRALDARASRCAASASSSIRSCPRPRAKIRAAIGAARAAAGRRRVGAASPRARRSARSPDSSREWRSRRPIRRSAADAPTATPSSPAHHHRRLPEGRSPRGGGARRRRTCRSRRSCSSSR